VEWSVTEHYNGSDPDAGIKDGTQRQVASGAVDREAESPEEIRADLTEALRGAFPPYGLSGPGCSIDRTYQISIEPLADDE
jgi:hypothetical protein